MPLYIVCNNVRIDKSKEEMNSYATCAAMSSMYTAR